MIVFLVLNDKREFIEVFDSLEKAKTYFLGAEVYFNDIDDSLIQVLSTKTNICDNIIVKHTVK